MEQLSSTASPRQSGTLPRNTVQNLKNHGHCMTVTTRGDKQTIDPPMLSGVEDEVRKDDEVVEDNGELVDTTVKVVEIPQKVIPVPRPQPPFTQRLVKNAEDSIYRHFITILKQHSINVPLIDTLEQIPDYAKFMKDMVTKKILVNFKDDDQMQHGSAIATRSLVQKKEDQGTFIILCTIGLLHFSKALCDIGASINLMPHSI